MAKRSPSGIHLPIIDQGYDQKPKQTLVAGGVITLGKDHMRYMIVDGGPLDGSTTVFLPADPDDGDEVMLASLVQFTDPTTEFLILNGNGHVIDSYGAFYNVDTVAWVKFSKAENAWIALRCCEVGETVPPVPPPFAVDLGTACPFAVLGATPDVNNTGPSIITGDVGVSPAAAIIGFGPPAIVIGTLHPNDAAAIAAQADLTIAYLDAESRVVPVPVVVNDISGLILIPGVYNSASTIQILSADVTLDGAGDPDAVWIFQAGSAFNVANGLRVLLINGAQARNVYWQVGSSATLGTTSFVEGTIMALTSITLQTGATLNGRALARNGTVSLDTNAITAPAC